MVATSAPRHWLLIRRKLSDPADLAFFYCHAPGPLSLSILVKVAGKRWPAEIAFLHLKKTVRGTRRALRGQSPELAR